MAGHAKSHASKPRLGRGLSSLITNSAELATAEGQYLPGPDPSEGPSGGLSGGDPPAGAPTTEAARQVRVDDVAPNPYQPRRDFDEAELAELARSITQQGILQPLVVCPSEEHSEKPYTLIAGERRLRAARLAGLAAVPCTVRSANPQQMLEWALVENIQRADLNPIERATAYREYMDRFALSCPDVAERVGKPRTTIANYLRLLELYEPVQQLLRRGDLSFGHAKVLAGLGNEPSRQLALARRTVRGNLSVRQLEVLAGRGQDDPSADAPHAAALTRRPGRAIPPYLRDMEDRLTQAVGTRVRVCRSRARHTGRILVEYYNLDDFDRIAGLLGLQSEQ